MLGGIFIVIFVMIAMLFFIKLLLLTLLYIGIFVLWLQVRGTIRNFFSEVFYARRTKR
jgi:hypothetical protein